jgi:peptidoglycan/LPS O-acetylase OafA/YrhL
MDNISNRLQELDALRGIAALMVVLFHFTMGRQEANLGFKLGTTGVDLFFIISGFVIFMSLSKVKNSKDFIINRISRLYPTYWACVSFTSLLTITYFSYTKSDITFSQYLIQYIGNMTMFQYYLNIPNIDDTYWTMIVEMNFYILVLFVFHFNLTKYIKTIGLLLSTIITILTSFFNNPVIHKLSIYIPFLPFMPLFFSGIIFYKIYTEKSKLFENYIILAICLICQILLFHSSGKSKAFISQVEYAVMVSLFFLLFTLFVNGKLKFIICKISLFLGKISFALYLTHLMVSCGFIIPLLTSRFYINFWVSSLFVSLPIIIGIATIITYYIEIPLNKKMREKLRTTWVLR